MRNLWRLQIIRKKMIIICCSINSICVISIIIENRIGDNNLHRYYKTVCYDITNIIIVEMISWRILLLLDMHLVHHGNSLVLSKQSNLLTACHFLPLDVLFIVIRKCLHEMVFKSLKLMASVVNKFDVSVWSFTKWFPSTEKLTSQLSTYKSSIGIYFVQNL